MPPKVSCPPHNIWHTLGGVATLGSLGSVANYTASGANNSLMAAIRKNGDFTLAHELLHILLQGGETDAPREVRYYTSVDAAGHDVTQKRRISATDAGTALRSVFVAPVP